MGSQPFYYDMLFLTSSRNFTCEMWNVTYTAKSTFVNSESNVTVSDVQYDHRFVPVKTDYGNGCPGGLCAYKGWHGALSELLKGTIYTAGSYSNLRSSTKILQTSVAGCPELTSSIKLAGMLSGHCPESSLERALEVLSQNITLSYFGALPLV